MTILNLIPRQKNCLPYTILLYILSFLTVVPLFMPVVFAHLTEFTRLDLENGTTKAYIVIRFLFGLAIILSLFASTVFKHYIFMSIPTVLGAVMAGIKLNHHIDQYKIHMEFAKIMNQPLENNAVLKNDSIYILMCSLFMLLCITTFLYLCGVPHTAIFVILFSVTSAIAAAFIIYTEAITCEIFTENSMASSLDKFNVVSFGFSVPLALCPAVIVLNSITPKTNKTTKYKPKRFKK